MQVQIFAVRMIVNEVGDVHVLADDGTILLSFSYEVADEAIKRAEHENDKLLLDLPFPVQIPTVEEQPGVALDHSKNWFHDA